MSFKTIRNLTSLLGLLITAVIIWYRGSPEALVSGVVLFMASVIVCLTCILRAASLKAKMETALASSISLVFVAWQIAIVGALTISSEVLSISTFHLLTDYAAAVLFYFFHINCFLSLIAHNNMADTGRLISSATRAQENLSLLYLLDAVLFCH